MDRGTRPEMGNPRGGAGEKGQSEAEMPVRQPRGEVEGAAPCRSPRRMDSNVAPFQRLFRDKSGGVTSLSPQPPPNPLPHFLLLNLLTR